MGETENIDEYKRALAVLQFEAGNPLEMIGLSEKHVHRLRGEFRNHGVEAFKDKRRNNAPVVLTRAQCDEVIATIMTTTPNDHGYTNSAFWSTRILATVIKRKYGMVYASKTTSYYVLLKKASFSFWLPGKRYEKGDPQTAAVWKEERDDRLSKAFSDPNSAVLAEDERFSPRRRPHNKSGFPKEPLRL